MLKDRIICCLILLIQIPSFSQQTSVYTNDMVDYNKALELYTNNQFLAAQTLFANLELSSDEASIRGNCSYYIANCAVRLNQQNADALMEEFVEKYPLSLKRNEAFYDVANYYFESGNYAYARKWYDKIDETALSVKERDRFNFNNGYTYFKNKRYNEAKNYFNRVSSSTNYGSQAKYYLGFIAYEGDDYLKANELFDEVKDVERYSEGLSYYQADMNFKLGKFQEAIDLGTAQYGSSNPQEKSELSKIIGESYFNLSKYEEAIPYLKEYKGKRGKWNNTDYYQLGYAFYKTGAYQKTINEFNKIIDGNDLIAQNAYYHLAESYLKLGQKLQALNAFKNASEMEFSLEIKEDAWLNYAKLSYELGNSYQSTPEVILSFIKAYPDSQSREELESLLIDSYVTSKNYKAAIELLESNRSLENNKVVQKVSFYRGVELYLEGNYSEALIYFDKSLKQQLDPIFTARATYWRAEGEYQRSNYEEAVDGFETFLQLPRSNEIDEGTNSLYHLGYTYFKLKRYPEAIVNFKSFTEQNTVDENRMSDAFLRLGDSYFITSQYWLALENYNRAIELNSSNTDYALYQKSISYGFVDRPQNKLNGLKSFTDTYQSSAYRDDALYELGNAYVDQENTKEALVIYTKLIRELPRSSYVSKALLKKSLIYDNEGNSDEALALFKRVAADFPGSEEALQAVTSAKIIYIDQGRVDDYASWIRTLNFVELEDEEIDQATYAGAEQSYLENSPKQAKTRFEDYLEQFPSGLHALEAHFFLGQLYFSEKENQKAINHYAFVVERDRNEFSEQALARISELYLDRKEYENALPYLKRLEIEADFPQNIVFGQTNSMKANYELKKYSEAIAYAEKVLQNEKIDAAIKSDARMVIARSAFQMGYENRAKVAYGKVLETATGKLAAEAMYYEAYFKHKEGDYEGSNKSIQLLAKEYNSFKYYGAKGLVLMAKNFYALEDAYQATFILESVIKNFQGYEDIIDEAVAELEMIKLAESKTNSSIETDQN